MGSAHRHGPAPIRTLDNRRAWARVRAPVWFVLGAIVFGASAAALGLVVLLGLARAYSFFSGTGLSDAPVWGWARETVVALSLVAIVVAVAIVGVRGLFGAGRRLLLQLDARPIARGASVETDRLINVVEALCVGLGVSMPQVAVIDDPAPNALSVRSWRTSTLVVTSGLLIALPRDELEAVCAHELAHLNAVDARWVDAALASLNTAGAAALALSAIGVVVAVLGFKVELWSAGGIGVLLAGVGGVAAAGVSRVLPRLRAESDAVADVVAVRLSRNPASLGAVCARLAGDGRNVAKPVAGAAQSWFKLVGPPAAPGGTPVPAVSAPSAELVRRAGHAYTEARVGGLDGDR